MAADAGYQIIVPYREADMKSVTALTQDAIFARPQGGRGAHRHLHRRRDAVVAADMLETAKKAMVPPFVVSLMADPSGAGTTTAAAMVASVEAAVLKQREQGLKGLRIVVLGGTGRWAASLAGGAGRCRRGAVQPQRYRRG